jgi:hypothetical protein
MNEIHTHTPTKPGALPLKEAADVIPVSYEHAWDTVRRTGELAGVKALRIGGRWYIPRRPLLINLGIDPDLEEES